MQRRFASPVRSLALVTGLAALLVGTAFIGWSVDAAPKKPGPGSKAPLIKKKPPTTQPSPTEPTPEEPPSGEEVGAVAGLRAAHNAERTAVGVADLAWSESLGSYAQTWANTLAANGCQLAHRQSSPYGENLFWSSTAVTADQVVAAWAQEKAHYDHETNSCSVTTCGHYTQVVWSATTKLGCGMASCGSKQVWVCNYDPRGNHLGQKPY